MRLQWSWRSTYSRQLHAGTALTSAFFLSFPRRHAGTSPPPRRKPNPPNVAPWGEIVAAARRFAGAIGIGCRRGGNEGGCRRGRGGGSGDGNDAWSCSDAKAFGEGSRSNPPNVDPRCECVYSTDNNALETRSNPPKPPWLADSVNSTIWFRGSGKGGVALGRQCLEHHSSIRRSVAPDITADDAQIVTPDAT